jgi:hypothetical protein
MTLPLLWATQERTQRLLFGVISFRKYFFWLFTDPNFIPTRAHLFGLPKQAA